MGKLARVFVRRLLFGATLVAAVACGSVPGSETLPHASEGISAPAATTGGAPEPLTPAPSTDLNLSIDYAALPQGRTPEGYYVLGEPDAPLVMQSYSDFL